MHFYRLVQFYTQRRFRASLSVRASDSGHPVTHARQFFRNKFGPKIYRCMSVRSIQHHTLLHNPTILHTNIVFAPACHLWQIYRCMSACFTWHHTLIHNPTIIHTKKVLRQLVTHNKKYFHFKIRLKNKSELKIILFPFFRVKEGLGLRSNQPLARNRYK